jgi:formylglycine-generating enzyme required for sulfatase activity
VDWYTAAAYCNWLSKEERVPPTQWCYPPGQISPGLVLAEGHLKRHGYRLPTEAEWEYACRAGAVTSRYYGRSAPLLGRYAWYQDNATDQAHAVGQLRPNDLGLFDMLGNAAEWCHDPFADYPKEGGSDAVEDGEVGKNQDATRRAVRGGSFAGPAAQARCAWRDGYRAAQGYTTVGLRVARTLD